MNSNSFDEFLEKLDALAETRGYSLTALAKEIGKDTSYFATLKRKPPANGLKSDVLQKMADVLGVEISWFMQPRNNDVVSVDLSASPEHLQLQVYFAGMDEWDRERLLADAKHYFNLNQKKQSSFLATHPAPGSIQEGRRPLNKR